MATAVGIDGCPAGWVAVSRYTAGVAARLSELLAALRPDVVGLDMPIGLADNGPRACDRAARRILGRPRAASVFAPPMRAALAARDFVEAGNLNAAACGRRLSIQSFNILPGIREVDTLLRQTPHWAARVYETHPEVCFTAMNAGQSLTEPKRGSPGHARRRELIERYFGRDAFAIARTRIAKKDAAADDIADAFACLFSAERIAVGEHESLPDTPQIDREGLPMRIVY